MCMRYAVHFRMSLTCYNFEGNFLVRHLLKIGGGQARAVHRRLLLGQHISLCDGAEKFRILHSWKVSRDLKILLFVFMLLKYSNNLCLFCTQKKTKITNNTLPIF
jgi:hypothetical protein